MERAYALKMMCQGLGKQSRDYRDDKNPSGSFLCTWENASLQYLRGEKLRIHILQPSSYLSSSQSQVPFKQKTRFLIYQITREKILTFYKKKLLLFLKPTHGGTMHELKNTDRFSWHKFTWSHIRRFLVNAKCSSSHPKFQSRCLSITNSDPL